MYDPYTVLGVSENAGDDEISKAYKKLARQYHPDLNPGNSAAEAKMKEINSAYEAIKDIRSGKRSYGSYENRTDSGTADPYEAYRGYYGGRYYEFDLNEIFGRKGGKRSFGLFDIFGSLIRVSLVLALLRFVFSLFFYPVFL